MAKRFPLYPIIPPLCWPCRIKFVCPISHYIPMISPWNHCIHRLNYCKSIPMVVPRHIYIFKRLSLCMCVNMRDFMWSILGFLTLYPLNSINSHYTIYIYIPLYPIIPPLCWPCRIKFVCPISHYIPMISPWNHCIHRLNYCKSIPMVVPRHIYIFKRLSLCMCVNMRDFMWSILGFLTLYPLNSINSHYTIYIYV